MTDATFTSAQTQTPALSSLLMHRIVSTGHEFLGRISRWSETRRTVAVLRDLSPRQLEDIGLLPGDIDRYARTGRF
ncbi:MAG: DUF1127 domain-containing protein [Paracoccaceae bacterium]